MPQVSEEEARRLQEIIEAAAASIHPYYLINFVDHRGREVNLTCDNFEAAEVVAKLLVDNVVLPGRKVVLTDGQYQWEFRC